MAPANVAVGVATKTEENTKEKGCEELKFGIRVNGQMWRAIEVTKQ